MRIRNAPDTLRLAMFAHPEYDDQYFRYVAGLVVEGPGGAVPVARLDSALWRAVVPGGHAVVRYSMQLPAQTTARRQAWKAYLTPTGGLVGGPHSFMYLLGATLAPAHVTLAIPPGWEVATGLEPTSDPRTFFAPSAGILMDSPIFVGRFRSWSFSVDGVPHRVVYWPLPDAVRFDTSAFVGNLERMTRQAVSLFGRAPYREFNFSTRTAGSAGLEHSSVTLASPQRPGSERQQPILWNRPRSSMPGTCAVRPARSGDWISAGRSDAGLWWSEGLRVSMPTALRGGLAEFDSTAWSHLDT